MICQASFYIIFIVYFIITKGLYAYSMYVYKDNMNNIIACMVIIDIIFLLNIPLLVRLFGGFCE